MRILAVEAVLSDGRTLAWDAPDDKVLFVAAPRSDKGPAFVDALLFTLYGDRSPRAAALSSARVTVLAGGETRTVQRDGAHPRGAILDAAGRVLHEGAPAPGEKLLALDRDAFRKKVLVLPEDLEPPARRNRLQAQAGAAALEAAIRSIEAEIPAPDPGEPGSPGDAGGAGPARLEAGLTAIRGLVEDLRIRELASCEREIERRKALATLAADLDALQVSEVASQSAALRNARRVVAEFSSIEARRAALRKGSERGALPAALRAPLLAGAVAALGLVGAGVSGAVPDLLQVGTALAAVVALPSVALFVMNLRLLARSKGAAAQLARERAAKIEEALAVFRNAGVRLEREKVDLEMLRRVVTRLEGADSLVQFRNRIRGVLPSDDEERMLNRRATVLSAKLVPVAQPGTPGKAIEPLLTLAGAIETMAANASAGEGAALRARREGERAALAGCVERLRTRAALARSPETHGAARPANEPDGDAGSLDVLRERLSERAGRQDADGLPLILGDALAPLGERAFDAALSAILDAAPRRQVIVLLGQPALVTAYRAKHPEVFQERAVLVRSEAAQRVMTEQS